MKKIAIENGMLVFFSCWTFVTILAVTMLQVYWADIVPYTAYFGHRFGSLACKTTLIFCDDISTQGYGTTVTKNFILVSYQIFLMQFVAAVGLISSILLNRPINIVKLHIEFLGLRPKATFDLTNTGWGLTFHVRLHVVLAVLSFAAVAVNRFDIIVLLREMADSNRILRQILAGCVFFGSLISSTIFLSCYSVTRFANARS